MSLVDVSTDGLRGYGKMFGKGINRHKAVGRHKFEYLTTPPIQFSHAVLS